MNCPCIYNTAVAVTVHNTFYVINLGLRIGL